MLNTVAVCGRLVKDATLEQVREDVKTRFTLACNRNYKDKKTGVTPCDFLDCEVWNVGANYLEQYARKGDILTVSGSVRKETWKDKDGNYHNRTYIAVDSVQIVAYKTEPEEPEEPEEEKPAPKNQTSRRR